MFTGIIQSKGRVSAIESSGGDARLQVEAFDLGLQTVSIGDSIAVSGVCLTVVEKTDKAFSADVSIETLSRTTFGHLEPGMEVNLERSLTPSTPLGGHLVNGHVDGTGTVLERADDDRSVRFRMEVPAPLSRYLVEKGSVCVDGISLTVNTTSGNTFDVNIIPHTLDVTTMGSFEVGRQINLEVDVIARYVEKMLGPRA